MSLLKYEHDRNGQCIRYTGCSYNFYQVLYSFWAQDSNTASFRNTYYTFQMCTRGCCGPDKALESAELIYNALKKGGPK